MEDLDTERFIAEVKKRPAIWDSDCPQHTDRYFKTQCWDDIVQIFGGAELNTESDKKMFATSLQRRWKNMRGSVSREMHRQRKLKRGRDVGPRKSEYVYFKQLSFLKRVITTKETSDTDVAVKDEDEAAGKSNRPNVRKREKKKLAPALAGPRVEDASHSTSKGAGDERDANDDMDEDRMFLLSLLKSLKRIPDQIKMSTKIDLMNVLKNAQLEARSSYGYH